MIGPADDLFVRALTWFTGIVVTYFLVIRLAVAFIISFRFVRDDVDARART